jgi:hypothetical protein
MSTDTTSNVDVGVQRRPAPNGVTWGSLTGLPGGEYINVFLYTLYFCVGLSVIAGALLFWKNRSLYPLNKRSATLAMAFSAVVIVTCCNAFVQMFVAPCYVTAIIYDMLLPPLSLTVLLSGWHVYFSFKLFKEKTGVMRWEDSSSSNSDDNTDDTDTLKPKVLNEQQKQSLWFSNHIWLAQPKFFIGLLIVVQTIYVIIYIIVSFLDQSWVTDSNCFSPALSLYPFLIVVVLTFVTIIVLIVLFQKIKDMQDGLLMRREMFSHLLIWTSGVILIQLFNFLVIYSDASLVWYPFLYGLGWWATVGRQVIVALREKRRRARQGELSSVGVRIEADDLPDVAVNSQRAEKDEVEMAEKTEETTSDEPKKEGAPDEPKKEGTTEEPKKEVPKKKKADVREMEEEDKLVRHLLDKQTFEEFKLFLESEFASENLLCWRELWSLFSRHTTKEKIIRTKLLEIYLTYVKEQSPLAVNWTYEVYNKFQLMCQDNRVNASIADIQDLLRLSLKEVQNNMRETFGRFTIKRKKSKD